MTDQILDTSTEPRAREKYYMTWGGTRRGTKLGEAARTAMLFKGFPIAVITRHLNREWQRSIKRGNFGPIAHLMAVTTMLGALQMSLRAMVQGKEPPDFTKGDVIMQAMMSGGGLGIYGDFLLSDSNRFGGSVWETALGPAAGAIGGLHRVYSAMKGGEDWQAQALRWAIGETPYLNVFYVKTALDYAFLYQLQELMSPGYLERMEKRLLKDRGQTFFKPPSEAIPKGGGDRFLEGLRE